ncbi:MAG TPA: FAD-dependent oxidoreductase [Thermoleophilaceae bacterium]|nr:FAD-dependent oxidoreductase [Thermoleophilaceae bacterium]
MASVVVVGAGVFGASLADRMAGQGWDVTLIDRDEPGHGRAESGGESRLMRFSHGPKAWYTRSAWRARELWLDLDPRLVVQSGVVWFARREDGWEGESERTLRAEGVPVERLDVEEAARLYPSLGTSDLAFVLHEPAAGILRARDATRALAARARERGARFELGEAKADGAAVNLNGRRLEADRVVWACGAWLVRLFPELVDLRVTQQDLFFFEAPSEWCTPPVPGFVDYDGAAYGLGALDGYGVKVAPDVEGPPFDPDERERTPARENERRARALVAQRFPALAEAPISSTAVCQYSLTADTEFIAAPHPEYPSVWLLGGGSGHGFKHGPAVGEMMAEAVMTEKPPNQLFLLSRFKG